MAWMRLEEGFENKAVAAFWQVFGLSSHVCYNGPSPGTLV
jgi:hypothetical protein